MQIIKTYTPYEMPTPKERQQIVDFLFQHLEQYGDPKTDIDKAIGYALKENNSNGGFIVVSMIDNEITGAVVVNETGMKDYIPENILVYIATHGQYRGKGIGKQLIQKVIELADGDIALHVEPDNPAKKLYERFGFTNKYLEMRLKQKEINNGIYNA